MASGAAGRCALFEVLVPLVPYDWVCKEALESARRIDPRVVQTVRSLVDTARGARDAHHDITLSFVEEPPAEAHMRLQAARREYDRALHRAWALRGEIGGALPESLNRLLAWNFWARRQWTYARRFPWMKPDLLRQLTDREPTPSRRVPYAPHKVAQRVAAVVAQSWRLQSNDRDAAARTAIASRADAEDKEPSIVKREAAERGLFLALSDATRPQSVRFGSHGVVTDADGNRIKLQPASNLHFGGYLAWLHAATIRASKAVLLDEPFPAAEGTDALDEGELVAPEHAVPHERVRPAEPSEDRVDAIYAAAQNDDDRALLDGLADGRNIADVARDRGLKPATARKRIQRLRTRLAAS